MRTFGWASAVSAAIACAAVFPGTAGEVHRWKDDDGRVHYGDKPPPGAAAKQVAVPAQAPAKPSPDVKVEGHRRARRE